jgi:hypothetical protein
VRRWCPTAFATMKTVFTTDWAPHIEAIARRLAQICAFVFCAGWALGSFVHRLNDRLAALLVRRRGLTPEERAMCLEVLAMTTQRLAAEATPANIAPPRTGIIHISDPMARAVRLVRDGKSQRLAAHICGVSRTSLQRALKK